MTIKEWLLNQKKRAVELGKDPDVLRAFLQSALQCSLTTLLLRYNEEMKEEETVTALVNRYLYEDYPVQYLTKEAYFFGQPFYVDERVLIPRLDTEVLVESVLRLLDKNKEYCVVEVGTGSGCIAITLKKELANSRIVATDISKDALDVAKRNARVHQVAIEWIESDILSNVKQDNIDVLISNPPYLTVEDEIMSSVISYEPHSALFSNKGGMEHYERIIIEGKHKLSNEAIIAFEVPYNRSKNVVDLIKAHFDNAQISIIQDYQHKDRVVLARIKKR